MRPGPPDCNIRPVMTPIESKIRTSDPDYQANEAANRAIAAELRERVETSRRGGDAQAHERHRSQGKLFVRDRIDRLLDPGSPSSSCPPWPPGTCTAAKRPRRAW